MTIMIVIASIGWGLLALMACLYLVGNKLNAEESSSLAMFVLAVLLSDELRDGCRKGVETAIEEGHTKHAGGDIVYCLMKSTTEEAKRAYKRNGSGNSLSLVMAIVARTVRSL